MQDIRRHITQIIDSAANQSDRAPGGLAGDEFLDTVRKVFSVLHGNYGTKFTSQFVLGSTDPKGVDLGIKSAQKVWASRLRHHGAAKLQTAVDALIRSPEHAEWPPTLPQIDARCSAIKFASLEEFGAIKPPVHPRMIGVSDEALREHSKRVRDAALARMHARRAMDAGEIEPEALDGVPCLAALVSRAVGLAGGDEAGSLIDFERRIAGAQNAKAKTHPGGIPQRKPTLWAQNKTARICPARVEI